MSGQKVRPKKFLGQHFLHDRHIAEKIVRSLEVGEDTSVLEIGPGMGVLTKFLVGNSRRLKVIEIDRESIAYLASHFEGLEVIEGDFLEVDLEKVFDGRFSIIGNFPYNISSQIFFHVLKYRNTVDQVVCMLQKEVADRICSVHGNKTYGILSVLLQTFYTTEYLFKVSPGVFTPPPKVTSAVIRVKRNDRVQLPCDEALFFKVVKQGFNNRRKTLRNALKSLNLAPEILGQAVFDKRAEQLSVQDFISLVQLIESSRGGIGTL